MNTRGFSAYNLARGALLNSRLSLADSGNQPLKLLDIVVSGMGMDPSAGLWLTPLHAIPAVPRVFPFDLIYLDKDYRVLDTAEMGPGIDFPAFHPDVASALVLPADTLRRTHTVSADRLIVCVSSDLDALLTASGALPLSNTAVQEHQPASVRPSPKPNGSSVIELTPEKPPAPIPSPATPFEHSILSAVAKVAETRNALEQPNPSAHDLTGPGPSMGIKDAVFDSPRIIQPAIIEHHIDPEDLFSNWVVTTPSAPPASRIVPPAKPEVPLQQTNSEPPRQNGRKSSAPQRTAGEIPSPPRTPSEPESPKLQARSKPSSPAEKATTLPSRPKTNAPAKLNDPQEIRGPVPQAPSSTTFTAVPYGMWQVSMPTAVAPMSGAKSPQPVKAPALNKPESTKPESPQFSRPPSPAVEDRHTSPAEVQVSSTRPAPKPQAKTATATPAETIANPSRPALHDPASSEPHKPGDFVASLQEKLQRVQQSKPAPKPAAEEAPQRPTTAAASMPSPAPVQPSSTRPQATAPQAAPAPIKPAPVPAAKPDAKEAASPAVAKSKPAPPVPATPKPEPSTGGFRSKFKQWLHPVSTPSDRRRAARRYVPGMVAHYFTGGAPTPHNVADISMSGMYLLTDDRWMPGTMIQMTLQKPCAQGEKKQSINVLSRIIRRGSDGVAAEFIMPEALSHISHDIQPSQATDKFALARFI